LGVLAHPVVVQGAPRLPVVHAERLAAVEPVRHHAVRLDPVDRDEQGGEVDDVLPDWLRLNLPPSHRLPGSGHVPTRAPWSPSAPSRGPRPRATLLARGRGRRAARAAAGSVNAPPRAPVGTLRRGAAPRPAGGPANRQGHLAPVPHPVPEPGAACLMVISGVIG